MTINHWEDRLRHDWSCLTLEWNALCRTWQDAVRKEFERRYIELLHGQVANAVEAMAQLSREVESARRVTYEP